MNLHHESDTDRGLPLSRREFLLAVAAAGLVGSDLDVLLGTETAVGAADAGTLGGQIAVPEGYVEWRADPAAAPFVRHLRSLTGLADTPATVRAFLAGPSVGSDRPSLVEVVVLDAGAVSPGTVRAALGEWVAGAYPESQVESQGAGRWLVVHPDGGIDALRVARVGPAAVAFVAHAGRPRPEVVLSAVDGGVRALRRTA